MQVRRGVAFLDLCGFTAFTSQEGDRAAVDLLMRLQDAIVRVAAPHQVRVVKWIGDGAMLIGPDLKGVFRAARDIRGDIAGWCPLPIRSGVAEGPMIRVEGDDYIGSTVNYAARLCDRAEPNDIRVAMMPDRPAGALSIAA